MSTKPLVGPTDGHRGMGQLGEPLAGIPHWSIQPEPSVDELVALVTVLTVALHGPGSASLPETPRSGPHNRWALAGRVAALASWPADPGVHWGRETGEADR